MGAWTCALKGIGPDGKPAELPQSLTVGTPLLLKCDGEPAGFTAESAEKTQIGLLKDHKFELKLLKTMSIGDTGGEFLVTSWKAGQFKIDSTLTDGTHTVTLSPIELNVATVIDQKTNPEGKPFPPAGPVTIGWPIWFWVMLAAVVVMALGCLAMGVFMYIQRRSFLNELEKNKPALTPFNQFNKELRKLVKGMPSTAQAWNNETSAAFFRDLETSLRWYLARDLTAPVLNGGPRSVIREIKRSDSKLFGEFGRELRLLFSEIQKARSAKQGASLEDATQLAELTRTLTEKIHLHLSAAKKGA